MVILGMAIERRVDPRQCHERRRVEIRGDMGEIFDWNTESIIEGFVGRDTGWFL